MAPAAMAAMPCRSLPCAPKAVPGPINFGQGPPSQRPRLLQHAKQRGPTPLGATLDRPGGGGAGVLDRPTISRPDNDTSTKKKKPRIYRVMLHNDSFNKREYVVAVIMRVIKSLSVDDAVNVMNEAHKNGIACVIACAQEEAEGYCEGLRGNGLISSIEPDGSGSGGPSD